MVSMILGISMVVLFALSARGLLIALKAKVPAINTSTYSKAALRVRRGYFIFATSVTTLGFLIGLVISFYQIFVQL